VSTDISLKAGYTLLFTSGVSRASNTIDYTLPHLNIDRSNNDQTLWTNMVTFGFEWNR
jgi:hypothetical protein